VQSITSGTKKLLSMEKRGSIREKTKSGTCERKITSIYFDSRQRYGSPRMTAELAFLGNKTSRITVAKYMKELGLRSKCSKKLKVTTNSKHKYLIVPNVLNRELSVREPSKAWVPDIIYIRVKEGFLY
jgi:putative transposase